MEIKIRMNTAPGWAEKIANNFETLLIGRKNKILEVFINETDSQVIWRVKVSPREFTYIVKRVARFDWWVKQVLSCKAIKHILIPEDWPKLEMMLKDFTSVDIVKEAVAQEIVDGNISWWNKIKQTWRQR